MSLSRSQSRLNWSLKGSNLGWGIAAVALLLGAPHTAWLGAQAPPPTSSTFVITRSIRVIEADTLELTIDGKRVAVGLVGVKAPSGNTACGRQAISALYGLIAQGVELKDDKHAKTLDKHHRRMFRMSAVSNKASVALSLAAAGLVRPDPDDTSGEEYSDISAAIDDAHGRKRGCV